MSKNLLVRIKNDCDDVVGYVMVTDVTSHKEAITKVEDDLALRDEYNDRLLFDVEEARLLTTTVRLRDFTESDARCFGGAEGINDVTPPMIGDAVNTVDAGWVVVVVDRTGVHVLFDGGDEAWMLGTDFEFAKIVARGLPYQINSALLESIGFIRIN